MHASWGILVGDLPVGLGILNVGLGTGVKVGGGIAAGVAILATV